MSSSRNRLNEILSSDDCHVVPGSYDALSALILEEAGFKALYMSGSAVTASLLAAPDLGLLGLSEMVEQARRIVTATATPLICDADNGYGNVVNVRRTVESFEAAGVAAVQLEDQVMPKRCGHFEGKEVISEADMVAKLHAAQKSRTNSDFRIIARTDARAVLGFDAALTRAKLYAAEGADIVFFEAPQSRQELEKVADAVDVPLIVNVVEGGKTPQLALDEYAAMGYKFVLYPTAGIRVVMKSLMEFAEHLSEHGSTLQYHHKMVSFDERNKITGLKEYQAFEAMLTAAEAPAARPEAFPGGTAPKRDSR